MTRPVIRTTSANVKMAELSGAVTVGNEITRKRFEKALGRKVEMGESLDLGLLAYHHTNPIKRIYHTLRIKKHPLND